MSTFELPSMYKCIYCLQGQCTATFLSSTKTWLEKPALFLASHVEVCRGNACGRICSNPVGTSCFDEDRCYNIAHDSALLCTDVPCMQIKKKGMSSYSIQQLFFPSVLHLYVDGPAAWKVVMWPKKMLFRETFYEIRGAESKHYTFEREDNMLWSYSTLLIWKKTSSQKRKVWNESFQMGVWNVNIFQKLGFCPFIKLYILKAYEVSQWHHSPEGPIQLHNSQTLLWAPHSTAPNGPSLWGSIQYISLFKSEKWTLKSGLKYIIRKQQWS